MTHGRVGRGGGTGVRGRPGVVTGVQEDSARVRGAPGKHATRGGEIVDPWMGEGLDGGVGRGDAVVNEALLGEDEGVLEGGEGEAGAGEEGVGRGR